MMTAGVDIGSLTAKAVILNDCDILGYAVMPDHLHAVWRLPPGDADYPTRWSLIKAGLPHETVSISFDMACVSAMHAVKLAAMEMAAGEIESAIAGKQTEMPVEPEPEPEKTEFKKPKPIYKKSERF